MKKSLILPVALCALIVGLAGAGVAARQSAFDPLKARFNQDTGVPRLVLLLSPT